MNHANASAHTTGLEPGMVTLRQAADRLGSSTTTLRKLIRQGRLPEAEKVKTPEGRVWAIPEDAFAGIAAREEFGDGLTIDLTVDNSADALPVSAEVAEPTAPQNRPGRMVSDSSSLAVTSVPSFDATKFGAASIPLPTDIPLSRHRVGPDEIVSLTEPDAVGSLSGKGAIEPAGHSPVLARDIAPTLAEVIDAALLETLLGAKQSEAQALVVAERKRTEYDALAARQLDLERQMASADSDRQELADRLHTESLGRAIADARVTELRDQLQREIAYGEAERYERRQAVAREAAATTEVAEAKAALGWRARRRLRRIENSQVQPEG